MELFRGAIGQFKIPRATAESTRKISSKAELRTSQVVLSVPNGVGTPRLFEAISCSETPEYRATAHPVLRTGVAHAAEQLETLISDAVKHDTAAHQVIDRLLDAELDRREERRLQTISAPLGPPNRTDARQLRLPLPALR